MTSEPRSSLEKPQFGPSDHLTTMFKACIKDPAEVIQTRLRCMLDTFLQYFRANAEDERTREADKCCHQAGSWYYKILEKLAIQESKRLCIRDMWGFFNDELQQKCLVACCLEITISTNRLPCEFPLLLQILQLAPYHFRKMIEPLIRAEENLPETAKKHLTQVEEKIHESLAWTSDSPLWEIIKANGGRLLTFQQVMPPYRLEDPNRSDLQSESNLPGVPANPDQQPFTPAESGPRRSKSLIVFLRKVYMMVDRRLKTQFSTMSMSDERQRKVWTCFEHSLVNFPDLMKDRHLDQMLKCAILIIDKVCNDGLIFGKSIKDSPTGNNNNVGNSAAFPTPDTPSAHYPVPCEEQRRKLLEFFNQVYSPKMSDFAKQFAAPVGLGSPPLTPYPKASLHWPSNKLNINISPLERGMTPKQTSGHTYIFHTSNSESLREINKTVAGSRIPNKRSCVALPMEAEGEEEDDDGPPPRRHCSDSQPALLRRLMDVENDRAAGQDQD
ncbi:retinoblastoma-like protein 1 [Halichoeres trimaculatus]|uniref:retinoblastoma-like protein 1 n=1 Tax=Halichoeres trimaculatus TaxID=147232 RepID=UPI003D9DDD60